MRAWLTPDDTSDLACYSVWLPSSVEQTAIFRGLFLLLAETYNWEKYGTKTPDEMAIFWYDVFNMNTPLTECAQSGSIDMPVGMVFWKASNNQPDHCLECDGAYYDPDDYPELFSDIGYDYGQSGSLFAVPQITPGRTIVASEDSAQDYQTGDTGGANFITLTEGQLPAHHHGVYTQSPSGVTARVLPQANTAGATTNTTDTGNGDSIDITNKYIALRAFIVAESA